MSPRKTKSLSCRVRVRVEPGNEINKGDGPYVKGKFYVGQRTINIDLKSQWKETCGKRLVDQIGRKDHQ